MKAPKHCGIFMELKTSFLYSLSENKLVFQCKKCGEVKTT
jgi:hypothetical protein